MSTLVLLGDQNIQSGRRPLTLFSLRKMRASFLPILLIFCSVFGTDIKIDPQSGVDSEECLTGDTPCKTIDYCLHDSLVDTHFLLLKGSYSESSTIFCYNLTNCSFEGVGQQSIICPAESSTLEDIPYLMVIDNCTEYDSCYFFNYYWYSSLICTHTFDIVALSPHSISLHHHTEFFLWYHPPISCSLQLLSIRHLIQVCSSFSSVTYSSFYHFI